MSPYICYVVTGQYVRNLFHDAHMKGYLSCILTSALSSNLHSESSSCRIVLQYSPGNHRRRSLSVTNGRTASARHQPTFLPHSDVMKGSLFSSTFFFIWFWLFVWHSCVFLICILKWLCYKTIYFYFLKVLCFRLLFICFSFSLFPVVWDLLGARFKMVWKRFCNKKLKLAQLQNWKMDFLSSRNTRLIK